MIRIGNGNELPLTLGEAGAVAGELRVVAIGQTGDEAVGIGQFGGLDALFVSSVQIAVTSQVISAGETARGVLLSGNSGDRYSCPAPILVSLPSLTPWRVDLEKGKEMRGRRLISSEKDEKVSKSPVIWLSGHIQMPLGLKQL